MNRKLSQPSFGMAVLMALIFVGLQIALSMPLGVLDVVYEKTLQQTPPHLASNPWVLSLINICAASGALGFGLFLNRMPLRRAIPSPRLRFAQVLGVVLVVLGGGTLLSEADNVFRWLVPPPTMIQDAYSKIFFGEGQIVSQFWLLVIVAPVTEELVFRGVILRGLLSHHRPWVAIWLTSLVFGAVHLNPWQFIPATLLGVAFGWFYLRTGSVPLCMLAHGCSNGLALLVAHVPVDIPGLTGEPSSCGIEFQPLWLNAAGLLVLLAGLVVFALSAPYRPDEEPPAPPVIPFGGSPPSSSIPPVIEG